MHVIVFLIYAPLLGFWLAPVCAVVGNLYFGWSEDAGEFIGWVLGVLIALGLGKAAMVANDAPASSWARAAIGPAYGGLLFIPMLFGMVVLPFAVYGRDGLDAMFGPAWAWSWWAVVVYGLLIVLMFVVLRPLKQFVAKIAKPLLLLIRESQIGRGGSAAFGGIIEDWAARYRPGALLLGSSLYDNSWWVGHNDDRGFLTIASSRSGKGRSAIIPNLLVWPGSALVIDPKGTNAAVTAERRAGDGQTVYVVDPFGASPFPAEKRAGFNPLDFIDGTSDRVTEDILLIADALVVSDGEGDSHWNEAARTIIAGVIAHLMARGKGGTLVDVRGVFRQDRDGLESFFRAMLDDHSAGGLPAAAASLVTNAGPNERGSFFTTVARNLSWLDSVAMQGTLSRSEVDLSRLKAEPMTVFVVLPPDLLATHRRFMRLFVNVAIRGLSQGGRGRHKVLFLLDEFYALGNIALIEQASGLLSGYGMKLWPIVQNLTQLQHLYPRNWETFFANAGAVQVFSVNDRATAEYLAARLGSRVVSEKQGQQVIRTVQALREVEELGRDVSRERGRQIIYRSGADPLVLRRLQYDKAFSDYAPDPDYDKPTLLGRLRNLLSRPAREEPAQAEPEKVPATLTALPGPAPVPQIERLEPPPPKAPKAPKAPDAADALPVIDFKKIMAQRLAAPASIYAQRIDPALLTRPAVPFDDLLRRPVGSTKPDIFERYEALKEAAAGDEKKLERAMLWLTGGYKKNLTGPDPFED